MISTAQDRVPKNTLLKIGTGYRLETEISRGPTTSIYRAIHTGDGQAVAVKVFHASYHADPRFAIRFREHLRRLAGLTHTNLVRILDYGIARNQHYIVMEWIEGVDLGIYLTEFSPLPPDLSLFIARQVCSALEAVHQYGLIHQGIKPANILLTSAGQVKVTDVGMSGLLSESGLSKTHVMLSGIGYIPPEQARGKKLTLQSDIYSLGVTLFEMLTGRLPFESKDTWSMVRMHAKETPPSPKQFSPQVPEELANLVACALQKDPGLRFTSASEMDRALFNLEKDLDLAPTAMGGSGRRLQEHKFISRIKGILDPDSIKNLLRSPWRIGGRMLPFGRILAFQFILAFLIAFAILYALSRFL